MVRKRLTDLLHAEQDKTPPPAEGGTPAESVIQPQAGRATNAALKISLTIAEQRTGELQAELAVVRGELEQYKEARITLEATIERLKGGLDQAQKDALQLASTNIALVEKMAVLQRKKQAPESPETPVTQPMANVPGDMPTWLL